MKACNFKIFSDSSCDLPERTLRGRGVSLVNYYVTVDGVNYIREYIDIQPKEFYRLMRERHILPKTSLPPIQDYIDAFRPALEEGLDIFCVCLTSKFSGSFNSANNAFNLLKEEFPKRRIVVFDSRQCTLAQGLLVLRACDMKDRGLSMDEIVPELEHLIKRTRIYCTVDSLEYLQRGGRIGKVAGFAGVLLNIKPVILMFDGELQPIAKVRGRAKAMREVVSLVEKDVGKDQGDYTFMTIHSDCEEECALLQGELTARLGCPVEYPGMTIGTTIGTHIGPTVIGVGYMPKN